MVSDRLFFFGHAKQHMEFLVSWPGIELTSPALGVQF